jgi:hypothetical protein
MAQLPPGIRSEGFGRASSGDSVVTLVLADGQGGPGAEFVCPRQLLRDSVHTSNLVYLFIF